MKQTLYMLFCLCWLGAADGRAQAPDITQERLTEFKDLTLRRVNDLQEYLTVIADKKRSLDERRMAIGLALDLFAQPDGRKALMQVSRRDGTKRTLPVEQYLNNLMSTRYSDVKLTFYDAAVATDFEKGTDGNYHATATYFQDFQGFDTTGKMLYGDRTRKDIAVTAKAMGPYKDVGQLDIKVFFGDVKVSETIPIPAN
ncbi:hypothetical protein GCM10023189_10480 [Nibrella saemangeumensis]|uniref:DUF3887 domain-containing protein n=1 Tax=Nibrella saemangeumensis TaxID=1084526 RepID=A0ABP8MHV6_9BACT